MTQVAMFAEVPEPEPVDDHGVAARHSSETNEHYTPPLIVEPARVTLGGFDLDPFSCERANEIVQAELYYDGAPDDDGVLLDGWALPWEGRCFVNPPGGSCDVLGQRIIKARTVGGKKIPDCTQTGECGLPPGHTHEGCESSQKKAWFRLMSEYAAGRVNSAVFICFSLELLQTTQVESTGPLPLDFPICYPSRRVQYIKADGTPGKSPPHSSCIILVPPWDGGLGHAMTQRFKQAFAPVGKVVVPS